MSGSAQRGPLERCPGLDLDCAPLPVRSADIAADPSKCLSLSAKPAIQSLNTAILNRVVKGTGFIKPIP
ncbi:hypothetical protein ROS1_24040 [Roseibium sp. ROS1]